MLLLPTILPLTAITFDVVTYAIAARVDTDATAANVVTYAIAAHVVTDAVAANVVAEVVTDGAATFAVAIAVTDVLTNSVAVVYINVTVDAIVIIKAITFDNVDVVTIS